jgi:uncharacterized membrane protein
MATPETAQLSDRIALLLLLAYTVVFVGLTIRQHNGFGTQALDLAKFDQAIWNTAHGRPFRITLSEDSVIQSHFSPALALYAPLYWLWPDVRLLFVVQALCMAGAGALIYVHLREEHPWLGLAAFAAYLMHPSVHQVNLVEFRRLTLAVLTTSLTLYAMLRRRYGWMALALGITLLCKEDMAFTVIGVGLYLFIVQRQRRLGALLTALGVAYLVLVPFVLLPALNAESGYRHAGANFGYLGDSLDEIAVATLRRPGLLLRQALQPARLAALGRFLWPTLGLFALAPEIAGLMLPYLAYLLTSTSSTQGQLGAWYPSVPLVFLGWATALGLRRLPTRARRPAAVLLLVAALGGWLLYSPLWPGAAFEARHYVVVPHDRAVRRALREIPTEATVAAQDALVPHLAHRREIYLFPWITEDTSADYVALDRSMGTYPLELPQYNTAFYDHLAGAEHAIAAQVDDFYLFRRVEALTPDVTCRKTWGDVLTLTGYSLTPATEDGPFQRTTAAPGEATLRVALLWRVERTMTENYTVFVHLLDAEGRLLAQHDSWPADAYRPTSVLGAGSHVRDVHTLTGPAVTASDGLSLRIGLYDSVTGTPLLLPDGEAFIVVPLKF